ncbi:molybdenum ABC transporter ATP-binding protein [Actinobacillus delphinicola]|uniref:Molybdate transporter ATP-binding protein n=1 Tax=Actinobacillus delphinicola TaxID=51161 RepID=A0A448TRF0_9PAST|nr:molybdenum ABC transporter ATP-binding protein ModC [Actinobacillus delphinicola]MDG6896839.1 molybdenum ABC transporter ATP-binding protein [Actinobacillus delphinicola]VEJ08647.1 molybdate transporter ATP-binding protein [Actinobacillus delphinicola]
MLEINVEKQLGQMQLKANLNVPAKGVTALFGLSGSGKSSLIQLISGLTKPDHGTIILNNRTLVDTDKNIFIPANKRRIGYVFQDARLFPHYRVLGNLTYGMPKENIKQVDYIVELLGISHLLKRYPITLSGGEKQRVAIGRALLTSPEILLMDEPLSALDLPRKHELLDYLDTLAQEINIPILYVTHSLDELLRLAERVVLLENGKVIAYELLEQIWHSPVFSTWQKNMERSSVLALPLAHELSHSDTIALRIDDQLLWIIKGDISPADHDKIRVCIFSSDVAISLQKPLSSSIRNVLYGQIYDIVEQKRGLVEVYVAVGQYKLCASITRWALDELALHNGQFVYLQIKTASIVK